MKTVLVLSVLLCAALAAPAEVEEKSPDVPVELKQQPAASLEEEPAAAAAEEMLSEAKNEIPADSENEKVPAEDEDEDEDEGSEPALRKARVNFCPNGWFTNGFRCYIFVNSPKNWFSAKDHCNSLGANLASVSSAREYSFLQQMTKTAGQSVAWLGGFHLQGRWMWVNNDGFYYTNWYTQPSATSYPCIFLYSTYGWSNTQCTSVKRFICSKTPFSC